MKFGTTPVFSVRIMDDEVRTSARRLILLIAILVALAMPLMAGPSGVESLVVEATVAELQEMMEGGILTAELVTLAYLSRIERIDSGLNAVISTNPDAIEHARALDEERRQGKVRGPLHGIPVLLKDNIEAKDQMPTTAGSLALAANVTARDAFLVARIREAGAVILGKTNLSEWANFRSERSSSGWSGVGGQTRNPYDTDTFTVRLEFGVRRGRGGELRGIGHRHRDQWISGLPGDGQRRGRHQADGRPGESQRHRAHLPHSGHRWTDGALGGGCGCAAGGDDRRRPGRSGD